MGKKDSKDKQQKKDKAKTKVKIKDKTKKAKLKKKDWVYAKDSAIHGKGLFAKRDITAGQVLGKVKGKLSNKDGPYVLWLDDMKQGFKVNCILKYINHAAKPNAAYYDDLTVVALKNIKKDQEITHDYGVDWD